MEDKQCSATDEGPERAQLYRGEQRKGRWYHLEAWNDRWMHTSLQMLPHMLDVMCDIPYTSACEKNA